MTDRNADRHKDTPIRIRPPAADRARLDAYAEATGRAVNAIVSDAIREYLDRVTGCAPERARDHRDDARPLGYSKERQTGNRRRTGGH